MAVFIIAPTGFRDEELFQPLEILEKKGVECKISSLRKEECTGKLGGKATATLIFEEINSKIFGAIVFVGGGGVEEHGLPENRILLQKARESNNEKKIVAAICIAPRIIANAGILQGKRATCFPDEKTIRILKDKGAIYTKSEVEVDGNIITANGPQSARKFGEKIVEALRAQSHDD